MMTKALFDALPDILTEEQAKRIGDTVGDVKAKALLDALVDTVAEVNARTL